MKHIGLTLQKLGHFRTRQQYPSQLLLNLPKYPILSSAAYSPYVSTRYDLFWLNWLICTKAIFVNRPFEQMHLLSTVMAICDGGDAATQRARHVVNDIDGYVTSTVGFKFRSSTLWKPRKSIRQIYKIWKWPLGVDVIKLFLEEI